MQLGMVGLGRMGANMVRRLLRGGHACVVFDLAPENVERLAGEGAIGASSMDDFVRRLESPRTAWIMVPAGQATESTVEELARRMSSGDTIVDGGNSYFKDDVRRSRGVAPKGIRLLDVGTSGGVWGLERGYCLMIGGDAASVGRLDPIFRTLAPGRGSIPPTPGRARTNATADQGYLHCGPSGAGHFVKMIHNGIEYGLMQAYAEGFDLIHGASAKDLPEELRFEINVAEVAELWRRGSVIGSWLLDLTAIALAESPDLEEFAGRVQDSGEGRWTVQAALDQAVPVNVLAASLFARFRSRREGAFADRLLSAMRKQFGGHVEPPSAG